MTVYEETSGAEAMPREVANAMSLLLNAARIDPVLRDAAVKVERYIRDLVDSEHTGAGE